MKTLAETQAFDGVVVPEDGVDARTAASLYPAFEALTGRSNWLKAKTADLETALGQARDDLGGSIDDTQQGLEAQLAAATARIEELGEELAATRSLVVGRYHKHSAVNTDYTLPAYSDIRVLEVDVGYITAAQVRDGVSRPRTDIYLNEAQYEGKTLTILATAHPPSYSRAEYECGVAIPSNTGDIDGFHRSLKMLPLYRDFVATTLVYVEGSWCTLSNEGGIWPQQENSTA